MLLLVVQLVCLLLVISITIFWVFLENRPSAWNWMMSPAATEVLVACGQAVGTGVGLTVPVGVGVGDAGGPAQTFIVSS